MPEWAAVNGHMCQLYFNNAHLASVTTSALTSPAASRGDLLVSSEPQQAGNASTSGDLLSSHVQAVVIPCRSCDVRAVCMPVHHARHAVSQ